MHAYVCRLYIDRDVTRGGSKYMGQGLTIFVLVNSNNIIMNNYAVLTEGERCDAGRDNEDEEDEEGGK